MRPREIRMAYARSRAFSVKELCLMEAESIHESIHGEDAWVRYLASLAAEQCRWAIAEKCIGGGESG